jgi:hypothetical protein
MIIYFNFEILFIKFILILSKINIRKLIKFQIYILHVHNKSMKFMYNNYINYKYKSIL